MSMDDLRGHCIRMKQLQDEKDGLDARVTAINKELDVIRTKKIPELMESMELRNCTIEGLGRVQLAADIYASTREGQKEAAMTWLRDCGYDNMITETYNASSIKALFRRMMADGADIPEDIFNVTPFIRASIVKA
jgi:hypothetical protein